MGSTSLLHLLLGVVLALLSVSLVEGEDAYKYYTWTVTYGILSPLGSPQQVVLIDGQFPGPQLDLVTNENVVLNLVNKLDEPFLLTWNGIKQRKNSWQDGVLGTNCPIPPNSNYTYKFQVKDQIGTYTYFPSTSLHKAAGGFGGLNVYHRSVIPVPYPYPDGDFTLLIGDWYKTNHKVLRESLDSGKSLAFPDGLLINGQAHTTINGDQGKTYMFRISNVGMSTSINFRIQGHPLKLVEIEGSHIVQNTYDTLDVHVGQSAWCFARRTICSGFTQRYRKNYKRVSIQAIKNWARQILQGLVYLHCHDPPVIHRDLKCDNIFVNGHLGQVKIGDLGLAAILHGSQLAHSVIGTPEFMAPELYEEEYNELADVYSFGMCVLEMLTSEYPYSECSNPAQIYKKVTSGKLPMAFFRIEDMEAQRFIGKCLVPAEKRPSAKELLLDPFLVSDDPSSTMKFAIQKPFLNVNEMEKLQLSDDLPRTGMKVIGKLNPENDTIFLKVQISDKDGSVRNVFFPFDILSDTPIDVATEMVKELEIEDGEPYEIANMIDREISALLPHRRQSSCSDAFHTFNYLDDDCDDDGPHHHFRSFSSSSSFQESMSDLVSKDDLHDDTSSRCSSQGTYSNLNYYSVDDHQEYNVPSLRKDKLPITTSHNKGKKISTGEDLSNFNQGKLMVGSQVPLTSKSKMMINNHHRLTRNRSLIDIRSQLLHRSLVEEVNKRRLFKTVGAVENIGFQAPCDVTTKWSQHACVAPNENSPRSGRNGKIKR